MPPFCVLIFLVGAQCCMQCCMQCFNAISGPEFVRVIMVGLFKLGMTSAYRKGNGGRGCKGLGCVPQERQHRKIGRFSFQEVNAVCSL